MKYLISLRAAEQTPELILQSLSFLFARLTRGRKPYRTLVSLSGTIYQKLSKRRIIKKKSHFVLLVVKEKFSKTSKSPKLV